MKKFMFSMLMVLIATAFVNGQGTPDTRDYLHFISLKSGCTLRLDKVDDFESALNAQFEYSTDNRQSWINYDWNEETGNTITFTNAGDTVWFRAGQGGIAGTNATLSFDQSYYNFVFGNNDLIAAGGNIMSLYDGTCQQDTMTENGFKGLFENCIALVSAPAIPATQMAANCYRNMFSDCTSLIAAPAIPATQMADNCCMGMFERCTSLITAPAMAATQVAPYCFQNMFHKCTSLTNSPSLPATEMKTNCYWSMFDGCISLTTAPSLPATELAQQCYASMFYGCKSLKVDTCDGTCTGALLDLSSITQGGYNWNINMFNGCKGSYANNIKLGGRYCITEYVDTNNYLHFVSLKGGDTLRLDKVEDDSRLSAKLEYSTDKGKNWTNYSWSGNTGASIAFAKAGDTIWFRAGKDGAATTNSTFSRSDSYYYHFAFGSNDSIAAGGNIMSLLDGSCQQTAIGRMRTSCFYHLFYNCKALTTAPLLPATELSDYCYESMFAGCSSLKTAPSLPATIMATKCYCAMFHSCSSLTTAPTLQATTLANSCYYHMFEKCSSLKVDTCDGGCAGVMLVVPDTTQAPYDWNDRMFNSCQGPYANNIKIGGHYCITGTAFNVNVNINDTTMGSVAGAGIYACGDTVTLTATAKAGYKFVGWSTGESTATISFEMENHDTTITATFALASGVEEIEVEKYVAYAEAGSIIVNGVAERSVAVYDMSGRMVGKVEKANETERFAVGISGVYVVTVDNKAEAKVIVK